MRGLASPTVSSDDSVISTLITRASAVLLALGGLVLLFASDAVLPRLIAGFPPAGAWLGQLLGAAWLGVAALNWASQPSLLGGIYGRPVVLTNAALYFIAAMALLKLVVGRGAPVVLWLVTVPMALFAAIYVWLLFRGPFERDFQSQARSRN
jgi:hypothetical protein